VIQTLLLFSFIALIYFLNKLLAKSSKKIIKTKSMEMVKCEACGLNLPKSEALEKKELWYCSKEHLN